MAESPFEATHPEIFARDLAARINELMADPVKCQEMGRAGPQARRGALQLAVDRPPSRRALRDAGEAAVIRG